MAKRSRWMKLLEDFSKDVRISSKEITSDDDRGVPLTLWQSQKIILREIAEGLDLGQRMFLILKSRQLGASTVSALVTVFWMAMHSNMTMAMVSESEKNRDKNRALIKRYVQSVPEGYFTDNEGTEFKIVRDNRYQMQFSNGSRIDFLVAGTKDKGTSWAEGEGYAAAWLTEVSAYGSDDGLKSLEESFAQQNPNRIFLYESTAKGMNHWRRKWLEGQANPEIMRCIFSGWWSGDTNVIERSDPLYLRFGYPITGEEKEKAVAVAQRYGHQITPEQLAWIRWKNSNAGTTQILEQNQPWLPEDAFVMSGFSFFNTRLIAKHMLAMDDEIKSAEAVGEVSQYHYRGYHYLLGETFFDTKLDEIVNPAEDGREIQLKVWEEPVEGGKYVLGCDTAFGRNDHKDRNVIWVGRCFADKVVQVAEFASNDVEVKHCAWILAHLAGVYRDCIVNIEANGPGGLIMSEWRTIRGMLNSDLYANSVRSLQWQDALGWARWYLYHRPDSMGAGYAYNSVTNVRTCYTMMHNLKGEYATKGVIIRSKPLLREMSIVIQDGSHIGAPESSDEETKDDRVFAAALGLIAWTDWRKGELITLGLNSDLVMQNERKDMPTDPDAAAAFRLQRATGNIVLKFFRTVEEHARMQAEMGPQPNQFLRDHGLI